MKTALIVATLCVALAALSLDALARGPGMGRGRGACAVSAPGPGYGPGSCPGWQATGGMRGAGWMRWGQSAPATPAEAPAPAGKRAI